MLSVLKTVFAFVVVFAAIRWQKWSPRAVESHGFR